MNKLTFKVKPKVNASITSLIKEVNKISCRIYIDLENGVVIVENVNDTMIDNVIELVDNYYSILGVEIDNTLEAPIEQQDSFNDNTLEEVEPVVEGSYEKQPEILEPQSEDDLIIKKIEFANEYVESRINQLCRTAYWAMYSKNVPENEIAGYITTCMSEISMRYSGKPLIEFSVGDIVDVYYGSHLPGEINGSHVHGIVCRISNEHMVYVVPITKVREGITSNFYLFVEEGKEVVYNDNKYNGGTALIDKAKYVRVERLNSVIGRTQPEFFKQVLRKLPTAFDFTSDLIEEDLVEDNAEIAQATAEEAVKTSVEQSIPKKAGGVEEALMEAIGTAFDKLDKSKPISEQVITFMEDIEMSSAAKLVEQSFVVACDIKKINYENVILELHNMNPNINEDIIKASLQEEFKRWLKKYPELAVKCPKISLISVLKVFAKKFA